MSVHMPSGSLARTCRRPLRAAGRRWLAWLAAMMQAVRTRRDLAGMDARMLKDIGLTRSDAHEEIRRAPWDFGERPRR